MKLIAQHSIDIAAPKEAIWKKLVDVTHWPDRDTGMERVHFDSQLALNSKGRLKLKGGPEVDLVITTWEEPNRYMDEFKLWGSRYIFDHVVVSIGAVSEITFSIYAVGLLGGLFSFVAERDCKKKLPIWMNNFKIQIEQGS